MKSNYTRIGLDPTGLETLGFTWTDFSNSEYTISDLSAIPFMKSNYTRIGLSLKNIIELGIDINNVELYGYTTEDIMELVNEP